MTLNQYLKAAGVTHPIAFGDFVNIQLPNDGNPRDYQVTGLSRSLREMWFGLWDDPGTGKTVVAQAAGCYWVSEGYKVLVLTLSNLLGQYYEDYLETFQGIDRYMNIHIFDQGPDKRKELEEKWDADGSWPEVLIMTYEGFSNLFAAKCPEAKPTWFYERGYRVMVADEIHKRFSNVDTTLFKRFKAWRDNGQSEPLPPPNNETIVMPMTGTPISRTLTDAYAVIETVNPGKYVSFMHFQRVHCQFAKVKLKDPITTKTGKKISQIKQLVGYREHALVNTHLFEKGRRVHKDQVLSLKEPNIRRIKVRLSDDHYRLYSRLLRERFLEIGDEIVLALNQQTLRQHALLLASCPEVYLSEEDLVGFHNAVQEAVLDWLEEADLTQQKVILFFNRRESIKRYGALLEEHNPAFMYGDITNKERERQKFLNDPTCRLLIANPRSASAGLNAQHVSHNVLFVEPTGVYGDFKQGLERVLRSGQIHVVDCGVVEVLRTVAPKAIKNMLNAEMDIERAVLDKSKLLEELRINV